MNLRTPRIIGTVLAATAALCIQVSAAKPLLTYEGTALSGAVRQENTICAPFRATFEYLGYEVDWVNGQAIADGKHYIVAQPGECKVTVDGKTVDTPVPVCLQNQRTIVPVRALFEAMGMTVTYDPASGTATVTSPVSSTQKPSEDPTTPVTPVTPEKPSTPVTPETPSTPITPGNPSTPVTPGNPSTPVTPETPSTPVTPETPPAENEPAYSESDLFWLARIVEAEAGGESSEGKLAVANVVLNRVDCSEYPDNIYDVIFDTKYGTQFEPTSNGTVYNTPSEESIAAAKAALEGENNIGGALYFYNPSLVDAVWIRTNCEYLETIGCHDFFQ